jgi:hypothetical protein
MFGKDTRTLAYTNHLLNFFTFISAKYAVAYRFCIFFNQLSLPCIEKGDVLYTNVPLLIVTSILEVVNLMMRVLALSQRAENLNDFSLLLVKTKETACLFHTSNVLFDFLGCISRHTIQGCKLVNAGRTDGPHRAEMLEQSLFSLWSNARYFVEH